VHKIKLLLNDFGGYPFPVELAHFLSKTGYDVVHCYCDSLVTTPNAFEKNITSSNTSGIETIPIRLHAPFNKYSWVKRWSQEREYGHLVSKLIGRIKPSIVLSANTPLDAMTSIQRATSKCGSKHVFWLQDILGLAMKRILSQKLPVVGGVIGQYYIRKEQLLLKKADRVVLISEDFRDTLKNWQIDHQKVDVIENWAPLEKIPVVDRLNSWSAKRGFDDKIVFLYSGTLSMKHDPKILADLAIHIAGRNGLVLVRSQGMGADWLREAKAKRNIDNLLVEGFGPFNETPIAFGSADVLVGLLEREASEFSVPSKVLAYLCAGRPLLLSMPLENLAAKIVSQHLAGYVVQPSCEAQFLENADLLLSDANLRREMGKKARLYAEKTFVIDKIGAKFDKLFKEIL